MTDFEVSAGLSLRLLVLQAADFGMDGDKAESAGHDEVIQAKGEVAGGKG